LNVLDQTGPIRLSGVTLASSEIVGANTGYLVLALRGLFDVPSLKALFDQHSDGIVTHDGLTWHTFFGVMTVCPIDDHLMLIAASPRREFFPYKELVAFAKKTAPPFQPAAGLAASLAKVDMSLPAWGVARFPDDIAKNMPNGLEVREVVTWMRPTNNGPGKEGMEWKLVLVNAKEEPLISFEREMNESLSQIKKQLEQMAPIMPPAKIALQVVQSVQLNRTGGEFSVTMTLGDEALRYLTFSPLAAFGLMRNQQHQQIPDIPPPNVEFQVEPEAP